MAVVEMRAATRDDAAALAASMRQEEVAEVLASSGLGPLEALVQSMEASSESWAVFFDGHLACIWGIAPLTMLGPRVGGAWLLTTPVVERYAKDFWRECKRLLPLALACWDELINYIDVRHEKAIRWAKRLGLRLEEPAPYGVAGLPFQRFSVRREDLIHV